jgi:hypothetical protein
MIIPPNWTAPMKKIQRVFAFLELPGAGPDLKTWTDDGELAWNSAPLLARLRGKKGDREIA